MDRDDPEKRIAELERQLAERQRGAALPPASPDDAAASRRFVASGGALVCVTIDGLTVNQWPSDVFTFRDAQLGLWAKGSMTIGTALHLRCGAHRFVLGGRDHRVATNARLEAAPIFRVDAWMWASDFDELLIMIGSRSGLDVREPAPTRCWLVSTSTIMGAGYSDTLAFNFKPSLAIDVGKDAIWVMDPYTNALAASAWLAQVTATPAKHEYRRYGRHTTAPILVVCVPGVQPLSIGCLNRAAYAGPLSSFGLTGGFRFSWRGAVPEEKEPAYWASGADWLTLVKKFGLTPSLEDKLGGLCH